jgi:hypothetical protein
MDIADDVYDGPATSPSRFNYKGDLPWSSSPEV